MAHNPIIQLLTQPLIHTHLHIHTHGTQHNVHTFTYPLLFSLLILRRSNSLANVTKKATVVNNVRYFETTRRFMLSQLLDTSTVHGAGSKSLLLCIKMLKYCSKSSFRPVCYWQALHVFFNTSIFVNSLNVLSAVERFYFHLSSRNTLYACRICFRSHPG